MIEFETLPLVEFVPSPNLNHKRVVDSLKADPPENPLKKKKRGGYGGQDGWQEHNQGDEQTLTFQQQDDEMENDLFTQRML
jgi:hypothetical protein